jgi:Glycosyl hydrolase family 3 N terminal domain
MNPRRQEARSTVTRLCIRFRVILHVSLSLSKHLRLSPSLCAYCCFTSPSRWYQLMSRTCCPSFPCGTAMGATSNQSLIREAGELVGRESIAKGAHVLLGPCINMQRSPLGGHGCELLSEDPILAGLGAAALVRPSKHRHSLVYQALRPKDQEHQSDALQCHCRGLCHARYLPDTIPNCTT